MSSTGVIATVGLVVATTESAAIIKRRSLSMRPVIAGFILGIFLFALQGLKPDIASKVMVLIVLSTLLINGDSLILLANSAPNAAKS
jgi:hypothetical protein